MTGGEGLDSFRLRNYVPKHEQPEDPISPYVGIDPEDPVLSAQSKAFDVVARANSGEIIDHTERSRLAAEVAQLTAVARELAMEANSTFPAISQQ